MKVSVPIITYNHEPYIAKALDSVLMQRTNFEYEIVVGEDCSTDRTRDILLEYQRRNPEKFRLLLNDKNMGMNKNGRQTLQACRGEYVAFLDGDDFWTSPDKLQKQVDFLGKHPECSVCFHDALIVYEDGSQEPKSYRPTQKRFSTVEDLLFDNFIPTSSVMFRRGLFGSTPDWFNDLKMGDWPTHILNALYGKIGYIDEIMAVYLVHSGGIWSTKERLKHEKAIIDLFEVLNKHLDFKYRRIVRRNLRYKYFVLSEQYEWMEAAGDARAFFTKCLKMYFLIMSESFRFKARRGLNSQTSILNNIKSPESSKLFKMLLRLYFVDILQSYAPSLHKFIRRIAQRLNLDLY